MILGTRLLIVLLCTCLQSRAQLVVDSTTSKTETKAFNSYKSPYSFSQDKFLIRKGFDLESYRWDNEMINLQIDGAMKLRGVSHGALGLAAVTFGVGTIGKFVSNIVEEYSRAESADAFSSKAYIVTAGLLVTSVVLKSIAKRKVRKAQRLRNGLSSK